MNIERTLFWFKDGDEQLLSLNEDFFGISTLLNRLLNEKYTGKKIKFINLDFATNRTYELHPILPKETPYYYGGHLRYYGLFDVAQFSVLSWKDKKRYLWGRAYDYIKKTAATIKNEELLIAIEYAYSKGLEENLNPDYRLLDININIFNQIYRVSLWIMFKEDGMYSKLSIETDTKVFFEKEIDKTQKGVEFFLEMYKALEFDGNNIIIKGRKDVDYLPLKVPVSEISKVLHK
jgi:hypothetical protein